MVIGMLDQQAGEVVDQEGEQEEREVAQVGPGKKAQRAQDEDQVLPAALGDDEVCQEHDRQEKEYEVNACKCHDYVLAGSGMG